METTTFLGLDAHWWLTIATWVVAFVTLALVWGALHHVRAIRDENKKSATLAICNAYDTNEVIANAVRELWDARLNGDLEKEPKKYRSPLVSLLNHLDGIAIGVEQGIYIEELAWDHMEAIVATNVRSYIDSDIIERAGVLKDNYRALRKMRDKWADARPRFEERGRRRFWRRRSHA